MKQKDEIKDWRVSSPSWQPANKSFNFSKTQLPTYAFNFKKFMSSDPYIAINLKSHIKITIFIALVQNICAMWYSHYEWKVCFAGSKNTSFIESSYQTTTIQHYMYLRYSTKCHHNMNIPKTWMQGCRSRQISIFCWNHQKGILCTTSDMAIVWQVPETGNLLIK